MVVVTHEEIADDLDLVASLSLSEDGVYGLTDEEVAGEGESLPAAVGDMDHTAIGIASVAGIAWHGAPRDKAGSEVTPLT
jgi:hypothetical protein